MPAPEFLSRGSAESLNYLFNVDLSSNTNFFYSLEGSTQLFLLLKCFSRYGSYLPELLIFASLVFLFCLRLKAAKTYTVIINILLVNLILLLFVNVLPFVPAESFIGYKLDSYGVTIKLLFTFFAIS